MTSFSFCVLSPLGGLSDWEALAWLPLTTATPRWAGENIESITSSCLFSWWSSMDKVSAKKFFFPYRWCNINWNFEKNSAHLNWLAPNHLGVCSASNFLWSVQISKGILAPSSQWHHVERPNFTAATSLSHTAQFLSLAVNFWHLRKWVYLSIFTLL